MIRSSSSSNNNVELGPRKTMLILVVVVGCFSVLWPKVFYPMLVGSANQQMQPGPIDKTTGCCDVISDLDVNTIKIINELCASLVNGDSECRKLVLNTCGIDISNILLNRQQVDKQILNEIRSLNGSLCFKSHFGISPWRLGVPHRIVVVNQTKWDSIRQERPAHFRPEIIHPALRERGRAIPASGDAASPPPPPPPAPRIITEGRPTPMRPPLGGPGHVVPAPQKGTNTMSIIMPIYTIGIVIFFTYTLMKLMMKKPLADRTANDLYPTVQPDPNFRKQVFEAECNKHQNNQYNRYGKGESLTKLGWKERDTRDIELDQLRKRLRETECAMERIIAQMGSTPLQKTEPLANGSVIAQDDDSKSVKVLGMEMTASCEGGQKWSRPNSPIIMAEPISQPPPVAHAIYLEGALPAQTQLLVTDSGTETSDAHSDPAVVLSGKMTLSLITLDDKENEIVQEDEDIIILEDENEEIIEESKYTTAEALEECGDDEAQMTDGEAEAIVNEVEQETTEI